MTSTATHDPITHSVKFYEKGDKPLEIVTSRQWYLRNGGRDDEGSLKAALIARGRELQWHPDYMRTRYENWIEGLNGDWLISRQRFFGVAFPVWYALDGDGQPLLDAPIVAAEASLPVDPSVGGAGGIHRGAARQAARLHRRPGRHGHLGHVVPLAADRRGLGTGPDLFERVFPMDLRPQAHDIIRTWLFATVVRSHLEHGVAALGARGHLGIRRRPGPQEVSASPRATRWCPPRSCRTTGRTRSAGGPPAPGPGPTRRSTRAR